VRLFSGLRRILPWLGGALWLGLIGAGWVIVTDYSSRPAPVGNVPEVWPADAPFGPDATRMTLVMFVHPRCSCSRASLRELAYIMARARHNLTAHIFFYQPAHRPDTWIETDLWHYARTIPFTTVHRDPDGKLAKRFGALASGQVVLFRPDGRRVFYGGITAGRGHEGPNPGRNQVLHLVREGVGTTDHTAVWGCLIQDKEATKPE